VIDLLMNLKVEFSDSKSICNVYGNRVSASGHRQLDNCL